MLSSEPLKDLSSAPVSRRTVAAGLWAAPVVALVAAAPAFAASGTPELNVTSSGDGVNRIWTVSFEFLPQGTEIIVRSDKSNKPVRFTGGSGVPTPTTAAQQFIVTGALSGSFTFVGDSSPTGTVTAGSLSQNFG
jgi:hypothetical protein